MDYYDEFMALLKIANRIGHRFCEFSPKMVDGFCETCKFCIKSSDGMDSRCLIGVVDHILEGHCDYD